MVFIVKFKDEEQPNVTNISTTIVAALDGHGVSPSKKKRRDYHKMLPVVGAFEHEGVQYDVLWDSGSYRASFCPPGGTGGADVATFDEVKASKHPEEYWEAQCLDPCLFVALDSPQFDGRLVMAESYAKPVAELQFAGDRPDVQRKGIPGAAYFDRGASPERIAFLRELGGRLKGQMDSLEGMVLIYTPLGSTEVTQERM